MWRGVSGTEATRSGCGCPVLRSHCSCSGCGGRRAAPGPSRPLHGGTCRSRRGRARRSPFRAQTPPCSPVRTTSRLQGHRGLPSVRSQGKHVLNKTHCFCTEDDKNERLESTVSLKQTKRNKRWGVSSENARYFSCFEKKENSPTTVLTKRNFIK